jgi:hypothetical protein
VRLGKREMKSSYQSGIVAREKLGMPLVRHAVLMAFLLTALLGTARTASAQVVFAGDKGGLNINVGATASGYEVKYGEQKLLGVAGLVDFDTTRRFGIEGEGRVLMFNNLYQVQARTYLGGARYHFDMGRFQVYGKGLVGVGQFTFPYNYAHGNYLVIAPGAGVDYRLTRRISARLADFEYQIWPQFTYGSMSSYGVSVGVRYRVF